MILMDMEFKKVSDELDLVTVNTSVAREHGIEVEHGIRLTKESSRATVANTPFKFLLKQVIVHLVYFMTLWLNSFLVVQEISEQHLPREIVTGQEIDHKTHCKHVFGSYVEAHEDPTIMMQ